MAEGAFLLMPLSLLELFHQNFGRLLYLLIEWTFALWSQSVPNSGTISLIVKILQRELNNTIVFSN